VIPDIWQILTSAQDTLYLATVHYQLQFKPSRIYTWASMCKS